MTFTQHILSVFCGALLWASQLGIVRGFTANNFKEFTAELGIFFSIAVIITTIYFAFCLLLTRKINFLDKDKIYSYTTASFLTLPIAALIGFLEINSISFIAFSLLLLLAAVATFSYRLKILVEEPKLSTLDFLKGLWPFCCLLLALILFFHPVFLKGLVISPNGLLYAFPPFFGTFPEIGNFGHTPITSDFADALYPHYAATYKSIQNGEWPLTFNLGTSVVNNASFLYTGLYSFDFAMILLFGPPIGFTTAILLRFLMAGVFTYLLLKRFNLQPMSALFGALVYTYSCYAIVNSMLPYAFVVPFLFYVSELLLSKRRLGWIYLVIAANLLTIFAGQIIWSFHIFTLQGAYILFRLLQQKISWKERSKVIGLFTIAGAFSILLVSFLIFPSIEHKNFLDLSYRYQHGLRYSNPLLSIMFFFPKISGSLQDRSVWIGNVVENASYFGIIPLILVLLAFRPKMKPRTYFFLALSILIFLIVNNIFSILELLRHIPIYNSSSNTRLRFLWGFCLPIIAAIVFDRILVNKNNLISLEGCLALGILFVGTLIFWLSSYSVPPFIIDFMNPIISTHLKSQMILILVGICLTSLFITWDKKKYVGWMIIIFTFMEFHFLFAPYIRYLPLDKVVPKSPAADFLHKEAGKESKFLPLSWSFRANFNYHYGLKNIQPKGFYTDRQRKFYQLIEPDTLLEHPTMDTLEWNRVNYNSKLLDLFNVKHIAFAKGLGGEAVKAKLKQSWEPVYSGDLEVYQNKGGYAPAFLSQSVKVETNKDKVYKLLQTIDPTSTVIIEDPEWPLPKSKQELSRKKIIVRPSSHNKMNFISKTDQDAFMLVSRFYHPAWKAYIDGKKVPITIANYALMGINLPRGDHRVKFKFEPAGFETGLKFSAATAFFLIICVPFIIFHRKGTKNQI